MSPTQDDHAANISTPVADEGLAQRSQTLRNSEVNYLAHDDEKMLARMTPKEDDMGPANCPPRKRFLWWSLRKKHWIAAIVCSVIVVLVILLLIVRYAIMPPIAQKYLDKVHMSINYLDLKSLPTDPNSREMEIELSVHVTYDSPMSASMRDAPTTLYYENQAFGTITIPAQSFSKHNKSFDLVIRSKAEITDVDAFHRLSTALVTDKQVTIDTRAKIRAHAMGLTFGGLHLDRSFPIKAFSNFADPAPTVNQIALAACTSNAYKLLVNTTLDNESQAGLGAIGALNLSVYYEQNYLGQALSTNPNVALPRGSSILVLELTILKNPKTAAALLGMVGGLLGSGVQFYIRGDNPNAVQVPLLQDAFEALNISLPYKDGLSKVKFDGSCDLTSILSGKL